MNVSMVIFLHYSCLDDFITDFDITDGDRIMEEICAGGSCRSCKVPVPSGQPACRLCAGFPFCTGCTRWLPPSHFDSGSLICWVCVKRQYALYQRSAFNGLAVEEPIITSDADVDLGDFLRNNAQNITRIIQEGIDRHT